MTDKEILEHIAEPLRKLMSTSDDKIMVEVWANELKNHGHKAEALGKVIERVKDYVVEIEP